MAVEGVWKLNWSTERQLKRGASACCMRSAAACRNNCSSKTLWRIANPIRVRRLHHRSAFPAAPARRHDRCYLGVNKVVGFGHQLIKALIPPPPEGATRQPRNRDRASCMGLSGAVPGLPKENGRGMDAADDGNAWNSMPHLFPSYGCRFSLWTAHRFG